jgi:N,N'-diacetylbacillosaminyl-diphospho-undecaprenol alpha-1,3-N-acetylgalactosaminyltransferase
VTTILTQGDTFTAKPNIYGTLAGKKAGIPLIFNLVEGLGSFYIEDNLKNILVRKIMEALYKKTFKLSSGCVFRLVPKLLLGNEISS